MSGRESEFRIDANHLDRDWLSQPELMHEYCTKLADAKEQLNIAKASLDVVEAEVARDARFHPSRYKIDKITEGQIANAVTLSAAVREARAEVTVRQHEVDVLHAAVSALENKKRALENLVQLWSMSYFSEPKAPEEAYDNMREARRDRALRGRNQLPTKGKK